MRRALRFIHLVLRKLRLPLLAVLVALFSPAVLFFWLWLLARVTNHDPHDPNGERFKKIRAVNPYLGTPEWKPGQNTDRYLPVVPTGKPVEPQIDDLRLYRRSER